MIWYSDRVQSTYWPWSEASVSVITGITLSLARPLGPNQTTPVACQTRTTLSHSCLRHITKEHRQKHQISSAQWGSCTRLETSIKIPQTASESFQRQRWGNFWEMGRSASGLFWAHRSHLEVELNWTEHNTLLLKSGWVILRLHLWQYVQCMHGSMYTGVGKELHRLPSHPKLWVNVRFLKNCGTLTNCLHNTTQQNTVSVILTILVLRPPDNFSWSICFTVLKKMHLLL